MAGVPHQRLVNEDGEDVPGLGSRKRRRFCASRSRFGLIVLAMSVFAGAVLVALVINILVGPPPRNSTKPAKEQYAVTSDSATCAKVGRDVFEDNGSAVDSAAAVLLCLGVVHPHSSGIGGGGFMVLHTDSNVTVYNFRETAPATSTTDMYDGDATKMEVGGLAVGIPGELRGLYHAWQQHGKLPWKRLVTPAVNLARYGFPLEQTVRHSLQAVLNKTKGNSFLEEMFKPFRQMLMPNGTVPDVGANITRLNLANTLEKIANNGSAVFYGGVVGESIIKAVRSRGGIMTLEDLQDYVIKEQQPACVSLHHGWKLFGAPPPASGVLIAFISNILAGYATLDNSTLSYHRMVEAFKFAYAQRSYLADPGFAHSPHVDGLVSSKLLNDSFASWVRGRITENTHNVSYYGGEYEVPDNAGTTHVSVVRGTTAVSVTSTINTYFGALLMTDTGIVLNNEMDDFSAPNITNAYGLPPSVPNFVEPGKRPLSSQSPTIVVDNKGVVRCVLGASGGPRITTNVYQVYANIHLKEQTVYDAVHSPRVHHQLLPDYVLAEQAMSPNVMQGLIERQHIVHTTSAGLAVVQAVERTSNGTLRAQADVWRKGGASYTGKV